MDSRKNLVTKMSKNVQEWAAHHAPDGVEEGDEFWSISEKQIVIFCKWDDIDSAWAVPSPKGGDEKQYNVSDLRSLDWLIEPWIEVHGDELSKGHELFFVTMGWHVIFDSWADRSMANIIPITPKMKKEAYSPPDPAFDSHGFVERDVLHGFPARLPGSDRIVGELFPEPVHIRELLPIRAYNPDDKGQGLRRGFEGDGT